MAQEHRILLWCDNHDLAHAETGDDDREPATSTVRVALFGSDVRELDLCDVCRANLLDPLADLLEKGSRPAEPPVAPAPVKRGRPRKSPPVVGQPAAAARATVAAGVLAPVQVPGQLEFDGPGPVEGVPCPLGDHVGATWNATRQHFTIQHRKTTGVSFMSTYGHVCPVCGQPTRTLGQHVVDAHGCSSPHDALEVAREAGDPFGVVVQVDELQRELRARVA